MSQGHQRQKLKNIIPLLVERGFAVEDTTGKKHLKYRITSPGGDVFLWVLASTPSDKRAWLNATQSLRRWLNERGYHDERSRLRAASPSVSNTNFDQVFYMLDEIEAACRT